MRESEEILADIRSIATIYTDKHFVYTGGTHGDAYANYRALGAKENLPLVREASVALVLKISKKLGFDPHEPIVLVGPESLGAIMAQQAYFASHQEIKNIVYCRMLRKHHNGGFTWNSSPDDLFKHNSQVILLDDALNAGSTISERARPLVEEAGGRIKAVGVIGDRSGLSPADLGVAHIEALERIELKRYPEAECPLCASSVPIARHPGHGHQYERLHPNYKGGYIDL